MSWAERRKRAGVERIAREKLKKRKQTEKHIADRVGREQYQKITSEERPEQEYTFTKLRAEIHATLDYMEKHDFPGAQVFGKKVVWGLCSYKVPRFDSHETQTVYLRANGELLVQGSSEIEFSKLSVIPQDELKNITIQVKFLRTRFGES